MVESIAYAVLIFCLILGWRNFYVFHWQTRWANLAHKCAMKSIDVDNPMGWMRFYEAIPPYDKMMLEFWRPASSFLDEAKVFGEEAPNGR